MQILLKEWWLLSLFLFRPFWKWPGNCKLKIVLFELWCNVKQARQESRKLRYAAQCGMRDHEYCWSKWILLVFSQSFLVGQKVNNNESVLEISFQQQKLTRRHNCCNIRLYWYKNISHRAAETVIKNHNWFHLQPAQTSCATRTPLPHRLTFASGVQCVPYIFNYAHFCVRRRRSVRSVSLTCLFLYQWCSK